MANENESINVLKAIEDNAPSRLAELESDLNNLVSKIIIISKEYTHYLVLNKIVTELKKEDI